MAPKPRATKRGTPVPMPKKSSNGPVAKIATNAKRVIVDPTRIVKSVKKTVVDPTSVFAKSTSKPKPKVTKKTASPKPKKPTLNDYLKQGKRPPIKPGLKLPSDADVIMKGYNDPATIKKYKKK